MPLVHLKTGRLEYKFEINNRYNIIKGDSGTGKTTLYDLVRAYKEDEKSVQNISGIKIDYIPIDSRYFNLDSIEDSVIIIDEGCKFLKQHNIASILQKSNNYFVIMNRTSKFNKLGDNFVLVYKNGVHLLDWS